MSTALPVEPFVHPALFYRGEEQYTAGTVPFLAEGLAAGEAVAVAVPGPNLELIKAGMGASAAEVEFLDMTRVGRNPGRIIPGVLRAFADAHPAGRVRIIGEPIWAGRSAVEYPACVQHEALINAAFQGREVTILCPYDADALEPEVLTDAYATHPVVIDTGVELTSDAYDPDRVVARYNQPLVCPPGAASLSFDAEALPEARAFAVREARELGLAEDRRQDLMLAVAELTTNSVVHGGGTGTLRIWADGDQIVCEVHDRGRLTDQLAGRRPPARDQLGGRGLMLVHYVSDLVRLHTAPDSTTVRFYLHR
ncbi:sensor histidine kinase [Streptomyces stelliscabiei]|uniref:Anti-sigma regulatory factor (Ser/Thr protein kinase) n=1 Tax=Streptomyces stelliscabiei TaxID=146820 RepID=A0A8I0TPA7_9ACTN|nr:sensor histidine kinase [Streptomyces stelliscabiei]KND40474.1 anti-sigma regulatory factor [Streptomyces stelliscabiei]MBE1594651.1 anti-sigma regulatory factor (Ser/Thr protein kinase) [Streptomyces stelliscabiei]MDX2521127.1 sensor histidine kinase [Streptomyces stelliscabiei]MDX2550794.1 sensor histidine kinase [Streptomyces stelliscabiei]MDX2616823.1 sensor histidine kinase [Streptomyces stelliscabiei]